MSDEEFSDPMWTLQLAKCRASDAVLKDSHAFITFTFVSAFKEITATMSAIQLVTIFAILAIVSGFSPSRSTYGRKATVSTTQIYEVSTFALLPIIATCISKSLGFIGDGQCKLIALSLKDSWQHPRFWEVIVSTSYNSYRISIWISWSPTSTPRSSHKEKFLVRSSFVNLR